MNEVVDEIYENETAEELYERIQREKERLISEGKLKKQKKLPEISEDEIPFKIPKSWKWVRLGEVVQINPKNYIEDDLEVSFIPMALIKDGYKSEFTYEIKLWKDIKKGYTHFKDGDIIMAKIVPCFQNLKSAVIKDLKNGFGAGTTELYVFRPYCSILPKYFLWFIKESKFIFESSLLMTGTAGQQRVRREHLENYLFPLPPLSEQKRISELIDRLFAKLDEAKEKALSALNTFELRKAKILHLAIQGKLSKQLDEYETAEELYEKIQIEKEKLISEGKLKKQKKLPEISEDEIPFEIPKSWKWVRLGEVFNIIMGQSPDGESINTENNGVEFHQGKIYFDKDYILESEYFTSKPTKIVEANTVLLCVRAPVGTLNITNRTICIGRGLCGIDTFKNIDPKFILYFLRGFEQDFIKKATGTTFIAITVEVIKNQVFPLPPLEEQEQILRLLDDIFEKEEKAKKLIESTLNKIELIKKSILARAVRGEL